MWLCINDNFRNLKKNFKIYILVFYSRYLDYHYNSADLTKTLFNLTDFAHLEMTEFLESNTHHTYFTMEH